MVRANVHWVRPSSVPAAFNSRANSRPAARSVVAGGCVQCWAPEACALGGAALRRKFVHTTDNGHALSIDDNMLARPLDLSGPSQAWVIAITYMRTRSG